MRNKNNKFTQLIAANIAGQNTYRYMYKANALSSVIFDGRARK